MNEEPKPLTWCLWTLLFASLAVLANGSWWQVPALWVLAVCGGTWAEHNTLWNQRKARRTVVLAELRKLASESKPRQPHSRSPERPVH